MEWLGKLLFLPRLYGYNFFPKQRKEAVTAQKQQQQRINEQIEARQILLIDDGGKPLGVIPTRKAIEIATERKLDLVEVASNGNPVVCKLLDYGHYSYREKKKRNEARSRSRQTGTKMVKFRPNTFEGDYKIKLARIQRFLEAGDKVKVVMQFRGREFIYSENGVAIFNRIAEEVGDFGFVDAQPSSEGRMIHMLLAPTPQKKRDQAKNNGAANGKPGD